MECPKCHSKLKKDYCPVCGYMMNGIYINKDMFNQQNSKTEQEKLRLRTYIGENEDKLLTKTTNNAASFFGAFYFMYRKCFLIGIIEMIPFILVGFLRLYPLYHHILIFYVLSFLFHRYFANAIYLSHVKRKLQKLVDKDLNVLKRKGGTSIIATVLSLSIIILLLWYFIVAWYEGMVSLYKFFILGTY